MIAVARSTSAGSSSACSDPRWRCPSSAPATASTAPSHFSAASSTSRVFSSIFWAPSNVASEPFEHSHQLQHSDGTDGEQGSEQTVLHLNAGALVAQQTHDRTHGFLRLGLTKHSESQN